ncbi:CHY zinc finger protein [Sporosarcina highlanderae]|uniref:CHY zinc finger protein n=1 Tax=Sporosarcina highlanderae TaxID=3035916 RepID=A0ABT8JN66_9BACL|nr:CHY zinc finger protein [Sporosarcina highlanderae]MDN4606253.1 CHY zinc finger protein [Sporosarcina highlanderae]
MNKVEIRGSVIDEETRCTHYHSELDIIAIKFYCCKTYFPCYSCHEESGCGDHKVWPAEMFDEKVVLCGKCKDELTVNQYKSGHGCPSCRADFNPKCRLHWELYFEK